MREMWNEGKLGREEGRNKINKNEMQGGNGGRKYYYGTTWRIQRDLCPFFFSREIIKLYSLQSIYIRSQGSSTSVL